MASPARLLGPLEAAVTQASGVRYVCVTCRRQCIPRRPRVPVYNLGRRYYASGRPGFAEKVRRKLWDSDQKTDESGVQQKGNERTEGPETTVEADGSAASEGDMSGYVAATTWEGLEQVGHLGNWWELPPSQEDSFRPFLPNEKLQTHDDILNALHRTVIELYIMKELNRPMSRVCKCLAIEDEVLSILKQVEVKLGSNGSSPVLVFPTDAAKTELLDYYRTLDNLSLQSEAESTEEAAAQASAESVPTADSSSQVKGPSNTAFLSLSLEEGPELKFAFLKRASQLTGHRIPDPEISSITSPSQLLNLMVDMSKPKPKKIFEILSGQEQLNSLPNVRVFEKKRTFADQEEEIGRWKVIAEELEKRDLPLDPRSVGRNDADKTV